MSTGGNELRRKVDIRLQRHMRSLNLFLHALRRDLHIGLQDFDNCLTRRLSMLMMRRAFLRVLGGEVFMFRRLGNDLR